MKIENIALYCKKNSNTIILVAILIIAAVLRFHKLTFQSLESDELQTLVDINPQLSWDQFLESVRTGEGVHPPFFFLVERYFVHFFGYSGWVVRSLCAASGVACVWAIFVLGKLIYSERLGLIAAALTCVNYFNIYFSQEARSYTLIWLLATVSYIFFIRTCKYLKTRDAILFSLSTILLAYTHYFGFLVNASELVIAIFFLLKEKENRIRLFVLLFLVQLSIVIAYIPWLPHLKTSGDIHAFWIEPVKPDFFIHFLHEYFGHVTMLTWMVCAFIVFYFIKVAFSIKVQRSGAIIFSFIFITASLLISLGIPYIRSVLVVPMLIPRYTIIALPSIIICIAFGIEAIPNNILRVSALGIFLLSSTHSLIYKKQYYRLPVKAQFREMTEYISANNPFCPLLNMPVKDEYYMKKYNFQGRLYSDEQIAFVDSMLQDEHLQKKIDTFWLVYFYNNPRFDMEKQKKLDNSYIAIKDSVFFNAFAQLYVSSKSLVKKIDYSYFKPEQAIEDAGKVIALWSGDIVSNAVQLSKGKYNMVVECYGTPLSGIYPHNNVYINEKRVMSFYSTMGDTYGTTHYLHYTAPFEVLNDTTATIRLNMDNDQNDSKTKEDRNTLIRNIYILKANN